MANDTPFRDAEAWLAARGIERDPIEVPLQPPSSPEPSSGGEGGPPHPAGDRAVTGSEAAAQAVGADVPVTARQAAGLAADALDEAVRRADERAATPDRGAPRLEDDVAAAVAFVRRSTSGAPQSEGRLREKLADRGTPGAVIEAAMERARRERLVDDAAMVAALVEERRRKGHAPKRIRTDLRARGFTDALLDDALRSAEEEDQEAAAFAIAADKVRGLTSLSAEAAFRRVVAHVARRGYPEGLARKVSREAVFAARDPERTAGH
jgi:SOS response regulatory protein OraA/RecX